jgi:hypothetical protein
MASEAQVLANRLNAQKSTGPCSAEGKAIVSQNAVKHGLLAKGVVIKGEDPGEFEFYWDQMLGELAPVGQMESVLAERVVSLSWWLQRAERLQGAAFDTLYEEETTSPLAKFTRSLRPKGPAQGDSGAGDGGPALGRVVVKDFGYAKVLDRLLMYERRIEHSLYRTMGELQRQRLLRELEAPKEEPTPEAASVVCSAPVILNHGRDAHVTETPDAFTTKAPAASTGPLASSHPPLNEAASPAGGESGTDSAKQSQSGADPFPANLFIHAGLREEGRSVPPQEQSQSACRGTPGTLSTAIS